MNLITICLQVRSWKALYALLSIALFASLSVSSADAFQLGSRWSTSVASGNFGSAQGNPITLTWSIVPDGTDLDESGEPNSPSSLISFLDGLLGAAPGPLSNRPWFPIFNNSYERLEAVSGLTFDYEPADDGRGQNFSNSNGVLGVRGDMRIGGHSIDGQAGSNTLAFNYFPNSGDMVIDTDNSNFYSNAGSNFRRFRNVLMHEAGHGLGLRHVESNNANFLMEPFISTAFDGPQFDDILALHRHYGGAEEKGGGNDTLGTATQLGVIAPNSGLSLGTDAANTVVAANDIDFFSIDDYSDTDYFEFQLNQNMIVDLLVTPQGPTYNQGPQGGTQSPFNAKNQNDLTLSLFEFGVLAPLAISATGGLGVSESINNFALQAGTYYARITGTSNAAQFYQFDLLTVAVPEPSSAMLVMGCCVGLMARRKREAA